jgi:hypothetical protein
MNCKEWKEAVVAQFNILSEHLQDFKLGLLKYKGMLTIQPHSCSVIVLNFY